VLPAGPPHWGAARGVPPPHLAVLPPALLVVRQGGERRSWWFSRGQLSWGLGALNEQPSHHTWISQRRGAAVPQRPPPPPHNYLLLASCRAGSLQPPAPRSPVASDYYGDSACDPQPVYLSCPQCGRQPLLGPCTPVLALHPFGEPQQVLLQPLASHSGHEPSALEPPQDGAPCSLVEQPR